MGQGPQEFPQEDQHPLVVLNDLEGHLPDAFHDVAGLAIADDTYRIFETWAYCLLRNHFHIAGFVRNKEDLVGIKIKEPSQYFSNCFNAYSRGVNLAVGRTGALFARPFKRIPVTNEAYLMRLIVYIHQNPQKHGFESNFQRWKYSSYHELTSDIPTRLYREKIWNLFGSREDCIRIHQKIQPLDLEEET